MKNNYSELIKKISDQKFPIYVFGGFAEDALLFGKTTRHHEDIDLLVLRKDTDKFVKSFQKLGFKDYEIYLVNPSGKPTVLHSENEGMAIEICIFDEDKDGNIYFDIFDYDEIKKFRIYLPKDVFDYPPSKIDGLKIQTVSPLAQYQIRAALGITKSFGDFRDKDIKSQKELKNKFFKNKTEKELTPKIVTI